MRRRRCRRGLAEPGRARRPGGGPGSQRRGSGKQGCGGGGLVDVVGC